MLLVVHPHSYFSVSPPRSRDRIPSRRRSANPMSTSLAPARHRTGTGLPYLVLSGLLWGTGGLTGTLLRNATGLSPVAVAAYRLTVGGALIVLFLLVTGRRLPRGRRSWWPSNGSPAGAGWTAGWSARSASRWPVSGCWSGCRPAGSARAPS